MYSNRLTFTGMITSSNTETEVKDTISLTPDGMIETFAAENMFNGSICVKRLVPEYV